MKKLISILSTLLIFCAIPENSVGYRNEFSNSKREDLLKSELITFLINLKQANTDLEFKKMINQVGKIRHNKLMLKNSRIYGEKWIAIDTSRIKKIRYNSYTSFSILLSFKGEQKPVRNLLIEQKESSVNAFLIEYCPEKSWHASYIKGANSPYKGRIGVQAINSVNSQQNHKVNSSLLLVMEHVCKCIIYSPTDTCYCKKPHQKDFYKLPVNHQSFNKQCSPKISPVSIIRKKNDSNLLHNEFSLTSFISPEGEPDFMANVHKINELLGIKIIQRANIEISPPPQLQKDNKQGSIFFVIVDELHCDFTSKLYHTFEQAYKELKNLSVIPWNLQPNKLNCKFKKTCKRRYQIIEYAFVGTEKKEISSKTILVINRKGVEWKYLM